MMKKCPSDDGKFYFIVDRQRHFVVKRYVSMMIVITNMGLSRVIKDAWDYKQERVDDDDDEAVISRKYSTDFYHLNFKLFIT